MTAFFGWQTHTVVNPDAATSDLFGQITLLPDLGDLPPSVGLGAVGMPGYLLKPSIENQQLFITEVIF